MSFISFKLDEIAYKNIYLHLFTFMHLADIISLCIMHYAYLLFDKYLLIFMMLMIKTYKN